MHASTISRLLALALVASTSAVVAPPAAAQPATHIYGAATRTTGRCTQTLSLHVSNDIDASASYLSVVSTCGPTTSVDLAGPAIDCFRIHGERAVVGGRGLRVWIERNSSLDVAFRTGRSSGCGLRAAAGDAVGFIDFHGT